MTVISFTITESPLHRLAGVPASIAVTTNIPATIFYTLDGTTPTIASSVVTGPIVMPTDIGNVTLKLYATDGTSQSPIVTEEYGTTIVGDRLPHATVTGLNQNNHRATYPFGDPMQMPGVNGIYGHIGGLVVDNPLLPEIPDGYSGQLGVPAAYTNQPYPESYKVEFSETDAIGQRGRGIGTLPACVTKFVDHTNDTVESSDTSSALFNPKALVIYQDSRDEPFDPDLPRMNRPYFNLENQNRIRDGRMLGVEGGVDPSGSMLKSHYNPRDNTMTYYYYDNKATRWIISKEPYQPKNSRIGNYSTIIFPSRGKPTAGFVFQWMPFQYRRLF